MLARIPRWLGTTLNVGGLIGCAACYVATKVAMSRGQACAEVHAGAERADVLAAQCAADAAFWTDVAIAGFVTALLISFAGVVIDRVQGWVIRASRRSDRDRTGTTPPP